MKLEVSRIIVPKAHRAIDDKALDGLADSIKVIGLQNPITVQRRSDGECELVAGRHRLEVFKRLGIVRIPARIIEPTLAGAWSVSENLHRVELPRLDRDEAIMRYARERNRMEGGALAQPFRGGKQPHDLGNSGIARELGMDRKQVRDARRVAEICEEAKDLLRHNGLDDSAKSLKSVAACETADQQIERVNELVRTRKSSLRKGRGIGSPSGKGIAGFAATALFQELKRKWEALALRRQFEAAPHGVRLRFIDEVLRSVR